MATESPYPRGPMPDYTPYREFEALARRFEQFERKQVGETLARLEERQLVHNDRLGKLEITIASIDMNVEQLQKSEMARAGFRLGTKELVVMLGVVVGMAGTIVAIIVAIGLGH